MDDVELFNKTQQGRDVNRHNYTPVEIAEALKQPVTQAIIALARVRKHPAFAGSFSWKVLGQDSMELTWVSGSDKLTLSFALANPSFTITATGPDGEKSYSGVEALASY
jgi:sucrose phosphorylase